MNKLESILIVTVLLVALRCVVEKTEQSCQYVSVINIIALLVVVYLTTEQIVLAIKDKISSLNVPKEVRVREVRNVQRNQYFLVYVPFTVLSLIYLILFSSSLGNDIISIIALGLSLCNNHIVRIAVESYTEKGS